MTHMSLRTVTIDLGNLRGQIFSRTEFAPSGRDPSSGALQWAHGEGNRSTERWAFVEPAAFARFVARALRAHESGGEGFEALRDEYNARAREERDPRAAQRPRAVAFAKDDRSRGTC